MSYIDYIKAKDKSEQSHPSTLDFAPTLINYGKIKCDLCGELCDVADIESETSTVTDAATGKQRFYHFCYKCLHKKMDINDVHGTFTEEETKKWRLKYKEAKKKQPHNTYEDMCFNCFISTNDIQMFHRSDWDSGDVPSWNYKETHPAFITVSEGIDREMSGDAEIVELHYVFQLHRSDEDLMEHDFRLCKGNGSMLCENCRFRKKSLRNFLEAVDKNMKKNGLRLKDYLNMKEEQ